MIKFQRYTFHSTLSYSFLEQIKLRCYSISDDHSCRSSEQMKHDLRFYNRKANQNNSMLFLCLQIQSTCKRPLYAHQSTFQHKIIPSRNPTWLTSSRHQTPRQHFMTAHINFYFLLSDPTWRQSFIALFRYLISFTDANQEA